MTKWYIVKGTVRGVERSWGFAVNIHGIIVSAPKDLEGLIFMLASDAKFRGWLKDNSTSIKEIKAPHNEQGVRKAIRGEEA